MIYQDIVPILEAASVGTFGTSLFWGELPSDPPTDADPMVGVYENPGPGGVYAKDGRATEEGRLQVLARSESYATAMQKALDVYNLLDDLRTVTNTTSYYFRALQIPFDVGAQDEVGRTVISCNYQLKTYPT